MKLYKIKLAATYERGDVPYYIIIQADDFDINEFGVLFVITANEFKMCFNVHEWQSIEQVDKDGRSICLMEELTEKLQQPSPSYLYQSPS